MEPTVDHVHKAVEPDKAEPDRAEPDKAEPTKTEQNNADSGLSPHIRKRLVSLTAPIFVEVLLIMMLGAVDTVMLGLYKDSSVAAVGVVNQLLTLVVLVFSMTSAGTSVLCAQYLGARRGRDVLQVAGVSLAVNLFLGIVLSAGLFVGGAAILRLMNLRAELLPDALSYIHIVGGFLFVQAVSMTLSAILRSANMPTYPMQVSVLVNILNIAGNYGLIFGKFGLPEMGVTGAALSTAISRSIALLLLFVIAYRTVLRRFAWKLLRPFPWDKLRKLLTVGLPGAAEELSYSLSQVVTTYFINMLGNNALTARTYAANIIMFSFLFAVAIGMGGAISVGHLIGENRKQTAYLLGIYCIKLAMVVSIAIALVSALCARPLMQAISSNPEVITLVATILLIDIVLEVGRAVNILCVNLLRAAGDVSYAFVVGLIVMWGVATLGSYVFGITLGFGLVGIWVAFTLDESIRAVLLARRWRTRIWMRKDLIR